MENIYLGMYVPLIIFSEQNVSHILSDQDKMDANDDF